MRNAFANELTSLAAADSRIVLLSGDIGNRLFDTFKGEQGDRFFNCGVAEANMMGMAAGLAMSGFRPIAYTITPFVTTRCLEQIRVDVCYHNAPVVITAVGAGFAYGNLGPTHHACEDIALLRSLPEMTVVCPGDAHEVRAALRASLAADKPVYLRLGKKGEQLVHDAVPQEFALGRALRLREGTDVALLACGNMLPEAQASAALLEKDGLSVELASFHTVKPLDEDYLMDVSDRCGLVVTIEEHSAIGGLGGAVAEWVIDHGSPVQLLRIAAPDAFFHRSGSQHYIREQLQLSAPQICARVHKALGEEA